MARQEEKHTSLAVTVRAIQIAVGERADKASDNIRFYGTEQGMLILVGAVETWAKGAASVEFSLNDGTGRIKARYYGSGDHLDGIAPGAYVQAFGHPRVAPELHLAVTGLRAVASGDEVSYHFIETAHSALTLQRAARGDPTTPSPKKPADAGGQLELSAPKTAPLVGQTLKDALVTFLQKEGPSRPEGVSLELLCQRAQPTPAKEVSAALQLLLEDGEVFTTIDDQHFQCV
mmetsp:Transcript_39922/g.115034  ORF Transcript_39922/g.115034 Transcript_39922/m.115034 type:complete len:232 (+) Transcript_39922:109-804(+)